MRETFYMFLLMLVVVPLAGEWKFYPFTIDFRVSFGTTAFFFFLLWLPRIPAYLSGLAVGIAVVLFRFGLDWFYAAEGFSASSSLLSLVPVFFFYLSFGCFYSLFRINRFHHRPLLVGLLGTGVEILGNIIELLLREPASDIFTIATLGKITAFAILRSFFVLSFFALIELRQSQRLEAQQRKRHAHILMLVSDLYEESILLKKNLRHSEEITRNCYDFYRKLKEHPLGQSEAFAQTALHIAGQVHEIKKDNQRIYAGLSKMISNENATDEMPLAELGRIAVRANLKYARLVGKEIEIDWRCDLPETPFPIYTTLSLLNNLVTNAIEAIPESGRIAIVIRQEGSWVILQVTDNGPGIKAKDPQVLFTPGFTTKFDLTGQPSTGIGLTYVKEVVDSLDGHVTVDSVPGETTFTVKLPMQQIVCKPT
ncbi:UNVERIFIED_CONTAM: two-component system sensor histidine kinase YcbA [Brevibacillus sp. OAP136]